MTFTTSDDNDCPDSEEDTFEPEVVQGLSSVWQKYTQTSTIAGIVYLGLENTPKSFKIFWFCVLVTFLVLTGFWSGFLYEKWNLNPMITTVKGKSFRKFNSLEAFKCLSC